DLRPHLGVRGEVRVAWRARDPGRVGRMDTVDRRSTTMPATETETTARATVEIHASRADVWRALTDPAEIKRYFMGDADVETDWKVGSPITFRGEWNGQAFEDKGEIVTFDPERELAYSHFSPITGKPDEPESYHLVDITLGGDDR